MFAGQARQSNVPSNVTNSAVVGDGQGKTNDKQEESADTKVNVEDAVVAKAPDGEEVDFKKISIDEALKVLKVGICRFPSLLSGSLNALHAGSLRVLSAG